MYVENLLCMEVPCTAMLRAARAGGSHTERFGRPILVYGSESDPGVEWVIAKHARCVESLVPPAAERPSGKGTWLATDFPQKIFSSGTPLALYNLRDYAGLQACQY